MDQLPALGRAIAQIAQPTFRVYAPLLVNNATAIRSTRLETHSYGPHPRQALDVYYPDVAADGNQKLPRTVLVFLYGGGLVRGNKQFPHDFADGLVHANVGHFFASRFGYTTIIPDYRLISHGAKFPSGGEDIAMVIEWVKENLAGSGQSIRPIDLFLMGNSAGGVHLSTFLFAPVFEDARKSILNTNSESKVHLRGAILLSVPFHFQLATPDRAETLRAYFGERLDSDCPLGMLKDGRRNGLASTMGAIPLFVLNGTLDPEDEILIPREAFVHEWMTSGDSNNLQVMTVDLMEGHNHLSPPLSLGTGRNDEEAWGFQIGSYIDIILNTIYSLNQDEKEKSYVNTAQSSAN